MQLQDKLNHLASDIQNADIKHHSGNIEATQAWIIASLEHLTEICELLSSGIADLAAKTAQLADACDESLHDGI